mmetsp:Transcript_55719/g.147177  ORF Transcript_55719/g.147177 Transcript_55719/m.147177 type:complete len:244 (-) Transcript_55719:275-1006(-)
MNTCMMPGVFQLRDCFPGLCSIYLNNAHPGGGPPLARRHVPHLRHGHHRRLRRRHARHRRGQVRGRRLRPRLRGRDPVAPIQHRRLLPLPLPALAPAHPRGGGDSNGGGGVSRGAGVGDLGGARDAAAARAGEAVKVGQAVGRLRNSWGGCSRRALRKRPKPAGREWAVRKQRGRQGGIVLAALVSDVPSCGAATEVTRSAGPVRRGRPMVSLGSAGGARLRTSVAARAGICNSYPAPKAAPV